MSEKTDSNEGEIHKRNPMDVAALPLQTGETGEKGSDGKPPSKQIDSRANPSRSLVAVIDEMLAVIPVGAPNSNELFATLNYWRNVILVKKVAPHVDPRLAIANLLVKHGSAEKWYGDVMKIWGDASLSPMGDKTPGIVDPERDFYAESVADLVCADCYREPDLILLKYKVSKCVECFLKAIMAKNCFQCKLKPTELIVRAIAKEDGKKGTVGVCMACFRAFDSAGRN